MTTTRPIVPRVNGDSSVGVPDKHWGKSYIDEGHFDSVKLNGGDLGEYLAESTGFGIISGCEPSISGLTVTVGAGVAHLADGTRKEIAETSITLDAAAPTNPRIDLVYINADGEVAKVTGAAAESPSAPALPSNSISVAQVSVAANANTGTVTDTRKRAFRAEDKVSFLFPQNLNPDEVGECQLIVTNEKVMMIDSHYDLNGQFNYLVEYMKKKGIKKIDIFLLSHYHPDHYENINKFLNNQSDIDFSTTKWYIPYYTNTGDNADKAKATIISWLQSANADYEELTEDKKITLADNVTVDIICNSAEFHAAINDINPNPHSNYALVKHGDVNVLFTGDGFAPEIQYILDNYNLPKIDLIKLQHHGTVSNKSQADTTFFRKIAAKYAVMNYGHDHYEKEDGWKNNDGYSSYVNYFGGKTYHACYNDVEFISDGKNIKHLTANVPAKSYQFTTALHFYVDKSADINITPDGSISKPFTSIMEAVKAIPSDEAKVYIHVKAGTYHSLRIENFKGEIQISKEGTGTINVEHISINNVGRVFMDGISANQVRIFSAYCMFDNLTLNVTEKTSDTITSDLRKPNSTTGGSVYGIALDDCRARIGSLTINGNNNSSITAIVNAEKSLIDIRTCIINNTSSAVFIGGRCCYISIGDLTVNNATEYILETYWGAIVDLQHTPTITNYSKSRFGATTSRWWLEGKIQGMGANRPANVITPLHYLYFDTTLKKLLIFNGSAWVDTTTGNTVS